MIGFVHADCIMLYVFICYYSIVFNTDSLVSLPGYLNSLFINFMSLHFQCCVSRFALIMYDLFMYECSTYTKRKKEKKF